MVHAGDYDAFVMSQRDAVEALKERHQMMSVFEGLKKQIDDFFMDLAQWGKGQDRIASIYWAPRTVDVLIAVVAADDDESGDLHELMSEFQLAVGDKYPFRLRFILFRNTEASGIDAFVDQGAARMISGAKR
jgi:hypothetical protein